MEGTISRADEHSIYKASLRVVESLRPCWIAENVLNFAITFQRFAINSNIFYIFLHSEISDCTLGQVCIYAREALMKTLFFLGNKKI